MKPSGIILELNNKRAIIMTSNAGFMTIKPGPGMFIGQRVDICPKNSGPTCARYYYSLGFASIIVFFFIFLSAIHFSGQNKIYAYVSVDINPSIEFSVNHNIRVIRAKSLNYDGKVLLRGADFINMPIEKALMMLIGKAEQHKYFHNPNGKYVLIATAAKNKSLKKPELLTNSIRMVGTKLKKRNIHLQFIQATMAQRKIALQNDISTGRYLLSNIATQHGQSINLSQAKTENIGVLIRKAHVIGEPKAKVVITDVNLHPKDKSSKVKKSPDIVKTIESGSKNNDTQGNLVSQDENSTHNAENDSAKDTSDDSKINKDKNDEDSQENEVLANDQKDQENDGTIDISDSKIKDNKSNSGNGSSNSNSNSNHSSSGNSNSSSSGSNSHSGGASSSSHGNSSKK